MTWFRHDILETGRLPLFCFFIAMILGFAFIRFSTRMIRAQVRWWPGNVTPGGLHIHHAVFGVGMMLSGGVVGLAVPVDMIGWRAAAASLFGAGSALVLDEFALILRLSDVYWSTAGRASVDAVFVVVAVTGLVLIGVRPEPLDDLLEAASLGTVEDWLLGLILLAVNIGLVILTLLKGKVVTGLVGFFFSLLIVVGAIRLARPHSPWARWFYHPPAAGRSPADGGPAVGEPARRSVTKRAKKLERAIHRERRVHEPAARLWTRLIDLVGGTPDLPAPAAAAAAAAAAAVPAAPAAPAAVPVSVPVPDPVSVEVPVPAEAPVPVPVPPGVPPR